MKVYIKGKRNGTNASALYNPLTKECTVLKGSIVSKTIGCSAKFRGADSIYKQRKGKLDGEVLLEDVTFKSASTAANFVTGTSCNGLLVWKDRDGKTIKKLMMEGDINE